MMMMMVVMVTVAALLLGPRLSTVSGVMDDITSPCPPSCTCYRQVPDSDNIDVVVDCARRRLGDIPPLDALAVARWPRVRLGLDLTANRIWRLQPPTPDDPDTTAAVGLYRVDLSANSLRTLKGDGALAATFGNQLEVLVLDGNGVGHVEDGAFAALVNLRRLSVAANRLWSLDGGLIEAMPTSLVALDLSRNLIEVVPAHAFSGMEALRNLSLARNRIRFVHSTAFGAASSISDGASCFQAKMENRSAEVPPTSQPVTTAGRSTASPTVGDGGWSESSSLRNLDLSYNLLAAVPCWGAAMDSLEHIILDGNPVGRLRPGAFQSLPRLRDLSITSMPQLRLVDVDAFRDVPQLRVLRLHDNRRMSYLDPRALSQEPTGLRQMSLHNGALLAVPALPVGGWASRWISAGGNPLHCDCNVRWLRDAILVGNATKVVDGDEVRCDSPTRLRGRRLADVETDDPVLADRLCPSVVVPFFDATTVVRLRHRVQLDCRAVGLPHPRLHWILPHRIILNASSATAGGRMAVDSCGSLTVTAVHPVDFGTYTCVALNTRGYDAAATALSASDVLPCQADGAGAGGQSRPRLLIKGVASTFVAVTWNGTDVPGTVGSDHRRTVRYWIVYRESESGNRRGNSVSKAVDPEAGHNSYDDDDDDDLVYKGRIHLRPYMRAFTVNNLRPLTRYEFCIGCELIDHTHDVDRASPTPSSPSPPHRRRFTRSNCIRIRTTEGPEQRASRYGRADRGVRVVFGMAVVITTVAVLSLCGLLIVVRRVGRRVSYQQPSGRWNAAEDCVDVRRRHRTDASPAVRTTLIPLSNLVELSSTPVSSSKTSLLHAI